jgi:hypothetical protein
MTLNDFIIHASKKLPRTWTPDIRVRIVNLMHWMSR